MGHSSTTIVPFASSSTTGGAGFSKAYRFARNVSRSRARTDLARTCLLLELRNCEY